MVLMVPTVKAFQHRVFTIFRTYVTSLHGDLLWFRRFNQIKNVIKQHNFSSHKTTFIYTFLCLLVWIQGLWLPHGRAFLHAGWEWRRCRGRLWSYRGVPDFTSSAPSSKIQSIMSQGRGGRSLEETGDDEDELFEVQGRRQSQKCWLWEACRTVGNHASAVWVNVWNKEDGTH